MTDSRIQAVFCMDSVRTDYARISGVSILSSAINCSSPMDIHIVTVRDGAGESDTMEQLRGVVEEHDCRLLIHEVEASDLGLDDERRKYIGTMLRLLIPSILDCDKAVYLDCDLAVNADLADLWDVDLEGCSIAGAVDEGISDTYSRRGLRYVMGGEDAYINAGVLIMDLKRIRREHDLLGESISYLDAHEKAVMRDQDAINCIFRNDKKLIDRRFNRLAFTVKTEEGFDGKILHYAGKKPWKVIRGDSYDEFWRYMLMLPWMQSPDECWRWMKDVVDNRTLAETLGNHGKIKPMIGIFIKAMKIKLLGEIGSGR